MVRDFPSALWIYFDNFCCWNSSNIYVCLRSLSFCFLLSIVICERANVVFVLDELVFVELWTNLVLEVVSTTRLGYASAELIFDFSRGLFSFYIKSTRRHYNSDNDLFLFNSKKERSASFAKFYLVLLSPICFTSDDFRRDIVDLRVL